MSKKDNLTPKQRLGRLKSKAYLAPFLDMDYLPKLSPSDAEWLSAFVEEHYEGPGQRAWSKRMDALNHTSKTELSATVHPTTTATAEDVLLLREELKK